MGILFLAIDGNFWLEKCRNFPEMDFFTGKGKGKLNRELINEIFPKCDFSVKIARIENKKRKSFRVDISHHDGRNTLFLREIREGTYRKFC